MLVQGRFGPTKCMATLRFFGADPAQAPRPKTVAPKAELDDKAVTDIEVVNVRLTLVKEYCSAALFERAAAKPELLASLLLGKTVSFA